MSNGKSNVGVTLSERVEAPLLTVPLWFYRDASGMLRLHAPKTGARSAQHDAR